MTMGFHSPTATTVEEHQKSFQKKEEQQQTLYVSPL